MSAQGLAIARAAFVVPLIALLSTAAISQSEVIVVDAAGGPGSDFVSLPAAVAAAHDGDTLLMRTGKYTGLVIDGKGITIVADTGAEVSIANDSYYGFSEIRNVPAGRVVTVRGVEFGPLGGKVPQPPTLFVHDDAGCVWLEDLNLGVGAPALRISDCDDVTVVHSVLQPLVGTGMEVFASTVTLVDTSVEGFDGRDADPAGYPYPYDGGDGGDGLRVASMPGQVTQVTLVNGSVLGGTGGDGFEMGPYGPCLGPGDGGDALVIAGAGSLVRVIGAVVAGGKAGSPVSCYPPGVDGMDFKSSGGTLEVLDVSPPHLDIPSPVRSESAVDVTMGGAPGAAAWLLIAAVPGGHFLPLKNGDLLLGPPIGALMLGRIEANGTLAFTFRLPLLAAGLPAIRLWTQVATIQSSPGEVILGEGCSLIWLPSGY